MRAPIISFLFLATAALSAHAGIINANLIVPPPCGCFPYLVDNANGVNYELFIWEIPDYPSVTQINGISLRFDIFDDGANDRQESFKLVLDIPGKNVELMTFLDNLGSNLGAVDPSTAISVVHTLTPAEVNSLLPVIGLTNGLFAVRVNRLEGDFYINSASATLDVEAVPEPGTSALLAAPMLLLVATALRRRRTLAARYLSRN